MAQRLGEDLSDDESIGSEENRPKFKITVEPTLAVIYMTQTLSDSVITELYLKRTCEVMLQYNSTICDALGSDSDEGHEAEDLVQPSAAVLLMWKMLISSTVPAVLSFFLGPWSDSRGRKPVIILGVAGNALMFSLYLILSFIPNLHPAFLLFGALPLAFSGGYINLVSSCYCFISDESTSENRSSRMALLEGSLLAGSLIGLIASPYLYAAAESSCFGFPAIFITCAGLCILILISDLIFVKDRPRTIPAQAASGYTNLLNISVPISMLKTCLKPRSGGRRAIILLSLYCLGLYIFNLEGMAQVAFLFSRLQFRWSLKEFMNFSSASMGVIIIGTACSSLILMRFFKIKDTTLAMVAFSTIAAQCILTGIAETNQVLFLYISAGIGIFRSLVSPLMRSILSKAVETHEIGKLFALAGSIEAIVPIASAPAFINLYNSFIHEYPGAPYIFSAILFGTCVAAVGIIAYIHKYNPEPIIGGNEQDDVSVVVSEDDNAQVQIK